MSAPRGTTPTFTFTFTDENLDLTDAENVYVTFSSGRRKVTKSGAALTVAEKSVSVALTQRESLSLAPRPEWTGTDSIDIQVNWTYTGGGRGASEVVKYVLDRQLLNEVLE